ncbi:MAG: hypothetical protein PHI66_01790 [Candidatus Pacebacteria bacterium]|nr:hypothetical protein [Candidatus Paceibacterota bacterium]
MENAELFYEITCGEKRARNGAILKIFLFLLPAGAVSGFIYAIADGKFDPSLMGQYLSFWVVLAAGVVLAMAVNKFFPYARRSYLMDASGITISKGNRNKKYFWEEFSSFFVYGYPIEENNHANLDARGRRYKGAVSLTRNFGKKASGMEGTLFYLAKKTSGIGKLRKVFVLVYGEPDNSDEVKRVLSLYIPLRNMNGNDQVGMISYDFK